MGSLDDAPLGSERNSATTMIISTDSGSDCRRVRRRGPRSYLALTRRRLKAKGGAPLDTASGQSEALVSSTDETVVSQPFLIYSINIRCLFANRDELCQHVKDMSPHQVLLQETWLNSFFVSVTLLGYSLVSRRDRSSEDSRGGIIGFVRDDIGIGNVVCTHVSIDAERSWHLLHLDIGSFSNV